MGAKALPPAMFQPPPYQGYQITGSNMFAFGGQETGALPVRAVAPIHLLHSHEHCGEVLLARKRGHGWRCPDNIHDRALILKVHLTHTLRSSPWPTPQLDFRLSGRQHNTMRAPRGDHSGSSGPSSWR
nr:hypothetical protein BgiMline_025673 [Biomphalaria glabrata]